MAVVADDMQNAEQATFQFIQAISGVVKTNEAMEQQMRSMASDMRVMATRMPTADDIGESVTTYLATVAGELAGSIGSLLDRDSKQFERQEQRRIQELNGATPRGVGSSDPPGLFPQEPNWSESSPGFTRHVNRGIPEGQADPIKIDYSIKGLRQRAASNLAERMGTRGMGTVIRPEALGTEQSAGLARFLGTDAANLGGSTGGGIVRLADGRLLPAGHPEALAAARGGTMGARAAEAGKGMLTSIAEGSSVREAAQGGLGAVLGSGGAKLLGGAGAVVTAGFMARDWAVAQRAKNAEIQSQTGGSQGDAMRERGAQKGFQYKSMFTMDSRMANQLYEGVRETGLQGPEREGALTFASDAYKNLGMSIEDSLDVVRFAAESGQDSLGGVADALDKVSKTAKEAGVNAEVARKNFVATWKTATDSLGAGQNTTALAGALSNSQTRMGRMFADNDFKGQVEQPHLRMVAANAGMSAREFYIKSQGEGGAEFAAGAIQSVDQRTIQQQAGPQGMALAADWMRKNPKPKDGYSDEQMNELGLAIFQANPGMDPESLPQIISQLTGKTVTNTEEALALMARTMTGGVDPVAELAQDKKDSKVKQAKGTTTTVGYGTHGESNSWKDYSGAVRTAGKEIGKGGGALKSSYLESVESSGKRSSVIEKLVKDDKNAKRKYKVKSSDGDRIVSGEQLLSNYWDQAARGDVEIVEGRDAGSTISKVTGMAGDKDIEITSDDKIKDKRPVGKSMKEYQKEQGGGGTLTIQPSPLLSKWLQFQTTGNVNVDTTAPPDPNVDPRFRH